MLKFLPLFLGLIHFYSLAQHAKTAPLDELTVHPSDFEIPNDSPNYIRAMQEIERRKKVNAFRKNHNLSSANGFEWHNWVQKSFEYFTEKSQRAVKNGNPREKEIYEQAILELFDLEAEFIPEPIRKFLIEHRIPLKIFQDKNKKFELWEDSFIRFSRWIRETYQYFESKNDNPNTEKFYQLVSEYKFKESEELRNTRLQHGLYGSIYEKTESTWQQTAYDELIKSDDGEGFKKLFSLGIAPDRQSYYELIRQAARDGKDNVGSFLLSNVRAAGRANTFTDFVNTPIKSSTGHNISLLELSIDGQMTETAHELLLFGAQARQKNPHQNNQAQTTVFFKAAQINPKNEKRTPTILAVALAQDRRSRNGDFMHLWRLLNEKQRSQTLIEHSAEASHVHNVSALLAYERSLVETRNQETGVLAWISKQSDTIQLKMKNKRALKLATDPKIKQELERQIQWLDSL